MLEKMKSPQCVENKVRIAPPDYSKENLLATFAPQRNLTPEQIFWSIDNNNRKKAETLAPKPISALTVYPPNTPVKLVPRILPTKSQVKINLYNERLRAEIEKVKQHYKEMFESIKITRTSTNEQTSSLLTQIEDLKAQLEGNLKVATRSSIKTQVLAPVYDVEKSRCLDLEAEMSKVHNESKHISKLEREYLNLQLKYQHLQESFDNNKSQTSQEAPDFNSFFKIKNLEHQIQEKDNVIRDLKVLISNVKDRSCEPYNANDATDLLEQNERLRAEIEKVKQHYKEMFESIRSRALALMNRHLPFQASFLNVKWRLLASLQAPFLKEKKGVRFSALYLQKKRNLLVFDHSHQQVSYFSMLVQSLSGSTYISCDSNVEYLRANLNIKDMSNSRRTSLLNIDYMLYPSLLRVVTDWKGEPSLGSTGVAEESYLLHFS
ncbi:hypothetical protein Tco_1540088 [Tanacetum coccineum]